MHAIISGTSLGGTGCSIDGTYPITYVSAHLQWEYNPPATGTPGSYFVQLAFHCGVVTTPPDCGVQLLVSVGQYDGSGNLGTANPCFNIEGCIGGGWTTASCSSVDWIGGTQTQGGGACPCTASVSHPISFSVGP